MLDELDGLSRTGLGRQPIIEQTALEDEAQPRRVVFLPPTSNQGHTGTTCATGSEALVTFHAFDRRCFVAA